MPNCKLIALTRPVAGREEEFNHWYDTVHLPELCQLKGMKGAQRYKLVTKMMGADENEYMALYDIEIDDPMEFMAALGEAAQSGKMTQTESNDMGSVYTALFVEQGERCEAK